VRESRARRSRRFGVARPSAVDAAEFIAELAETFTVVEAAYNPW
jgi:hypothetical protein